jgi:hypothetical protein
MERKSASVNLNPTLVLDLDDCVTVKHRKKANPLLNQRIQERFPDSRCWDLTFKVDGEQIEAMHFVAPGWIPCLKVIVHEWKWNLAIFSSGCVERNKLVRFHLAQELKLSEDDISLFSKHNLVDYDKYESKGTENWIPSRYYGTYKKDLEHVGLDLQETLLVDDDPSYVIAPDQWPQLIVESNGGYSELASWFSSEKCRVDTTAVSRFLNIPFQVLGFVSECRERKLAQGASLRSILKTLLPPVSKTGSKTPTEEQRLGWETKGKAILQREKV